MSSHWIIAEYDDRVIERFPLKSKNIVVKIVDHNGIDDNGHSKKINSQPCHLGAFILSHSKRLMNDVLIALDGFKNHKIYYSDTDNVYIHKMITRFKKNKSYLVKIYINQKTIRVTLVFYMPCLRMLKSSIV